MILAATATGLLLALPAQTTPTLTLKPCDVQAVRARCGTLLVPENRSLPFGRRIGLRVVVVPARRKPVAPDAFTYLAGGPGGAATAATYGLASLFAAVNEHHDLLLVDQRGTGGSNALFCPAPKTQPASPTQMRSYVRSCLESVRGDPVQYGTRAAMDDLDAVRAALGYRQLDVYGASYGATAAQVYLKEHPSSVRTLILDGATALDVPFYGRFAQGAERALDRIAALCAADDGCRRTFPGWRGQFDRLVRAWNAHPVHNRKGETTTGTGLAGVVQQMLLDVSNAVSIPLVVSRAARGDYEPLNRQIPKGGGGGPTRQLMYWSIWCNEPWVGMGARGPWGTPFDGFAAVSIASRRAVCAYLPGRAEPAERWTFPRGSTPVLALAGGADPQDPIANLPRLKANFPNSRAIVVPDYGHTVGQFGCLRDVVARFVDRATAKGLNTSCVAAIVPPPFPLS